MKTPLHSAALQSAAASESAGFNSRTRILALGASLMLVGIWIVALVGPAQAQTETVVYNFANPPDAYGPKCNLVADAAGNLYGTTFSGGVNNLGAVFVVSPSGTESVFYSFVGGTDGSHPVAGLFRDKTTGNLYGTTTAGGTANSGTVFTLTPAGVETVLYSFKGGATDGANPYGSVVRIGTNIFGTTFNGGAFGYGIVFRVTAAGTETVLHSFDAAFPTLDGSHPTSGLVPFNGVLYGTTSMGGPGNLGTVYSITTGGVESVLYAFKGGVNDGQDPVGGVVFDKSGNLYGTTYSGGLKNSGTVFAITSAGEVVLHHFLRKTGDGANPQSSLVFFKGKFYGTTFQGGTANGGTVFSITATGAEAVLHSFTGGTDGFNPYSSVVVGANNALYSTTLQGGATNLGTVFKLIP